MIGMNKIGDYHLVYDGEPLSDHFIIKNVELPLTPTLDAETITIDGRPGKWFSSKKIETRKIIVHAALMNDNRNRIDMMEKWMLQSDILVKNKECKLELGGGYWVNAILIGETPIKRDKNGRWSEVDLNFMCYDPYIYGEEHIHEFEKEAGKATFSESVYIYGKLPVWPIFELEERGYLWVTYLPDAGTVALMADNLSDYRITIDTEKHMCYDVLMNYMPMYTTSVFGAMEPGRRSITSNASRLTMIYTERYI